MSYTLQELASEDLELLRAAETQDDDNKITYGEVDGISSTLSVICVHNEGEDHERDDEEHGRNFFDKLKAFFSSSKTPCCEFNIILYQEIPGEAAMGFLLYEGEKDQDDEVFEAYEALQATMKPLLYEGKVKLTKDLLKELVSPKPMEPAKIRQHLVELIEHNRDAHPEWHSVVDTLNSYFHRPSLVPQLSLDFSSGEENLKQSLANAFIVHPVIGGVADTKVADIGVGSVATAGAGGVAGGMAAIGAAGAYNGVIGGVIGGVAGGVIGGVAGGVVGGIGLFSDIVGKVAKGAEGFRGLEGLNSLDADGKTLLMIAIEKRYIDCSMYLLLGGSDPSKVHLDTGNTPLHMAVLAGNATLVKMLLVFSADVTITNRKDETALDCAKKSNDKNAQEMCDALQLAADRLKKSKSYFKRNKSVPESRGSKETYLLSMDGGGIRAFNIAQAIVAIDNRMRQLDPKCKPFMSHFDYIAGTSSGGIAALLLAYTDATPATSRAVVYKIITDVFAKSRNKRGCKMKQYLQAILPDDLCMADNLSPRVIITATLANHKPSKLHLMTNYGDPRDNQLGPKERKVWEAGRATSAAPHHFPPFRKYFLDGGIMANNPTIDAMAELLAKLREENSDSKLTCVLSLGTGCIAPTEMNNVDMYLPGFNLATLVKIPSAVMGISNLVSMLLDHITRADGEEVTRARSWCDSIGCDYFRVSSILEEEIDPTSTDVDKIVDMLFNTEMQLLDCPEKIDKIARKLLSK